MTSPPPRSPDQIAAASAGLAATGACCGHTYGAHAPDGCRVCQAQGRTPGAGQLCEGWRPVDPFGPAGIDPWHSPADVNRAADTIADAMAVAIGGAGDNDDTTQRVLAVLRQHRDHLEVVLATDDVIEAEVLDPVGDAIRAALEGALIHDRDRVPHAAAAVVSALEEHADDVANYLGLRRPAGGELDGERLAALARAIATATDRYNGEGTAVLAALARDGWRLERTGIQVG